MPIFEQHLEQALADRLDVAGCAPRPAVSSPSSPAAGSARRVSSARYGLTADGAVAEQQRDVHDLARLAATRPRGRTSCARPRARGGVCTAAVASRAGIGAALGVDAAIGEHEDRGAGRRPPARPGGTARRARARAPRPPSRRVEQRRAGSRAEAVARQVPQLLEVAVLQHGLHQRHPPARPPGARRAGCRCAPTAVRRLITSVSRCGSMGGFVTCANCCLKYAASSFGPRREGGERRVDRPSSATGSAPSRAIGAISSRSSSSV